MKTKLIALSMMITTVSLIFQLPSVLTAQGIELGQEQPGRTTTAPHEFSWSLDIPYDQVSTKAVLRAANSAAIEFKSQNGLSLSGKAPVVKMVPHLVLYRNGELTSPAERTLIFEISHLPVPSGGITLTVEIETQHPDPDQGSGSRDRIVLWKQDKTIRSASERNDPDVTVVMTHTFDAVIESDAGNIPTPTDYLKFNLTMTDALHSMVKPLYEHSEEFAVLLESQWIEPLMSLNEAVEGAAPDQLVVYACDMFPFQHVEWDDSSRTSRDAVGKYVQDELIPLMVQAVHAQTNDWGFVWYPEWTSYRAGEDSERLSVALTRPGVWFHGRAPGSAHSGISINTKHKDYAAYNNLTEAVMGAFHHELFHNLQRNVHQKSGGDGNIDADAGALAFFTEGMAIMATSVGQPEVEFRGERAYILQANSFLTGDQFRESYLKTGYDGINPYRAALFWRFLFEKCGGIVDGVEDPSAGMQIIRKTLERLYRQETRGMKFKNRLSENLPFVLDEALRETPACPFRSYEESLASFALHIYALQLEDGYCSAEVARGGCDLFDPGNLYKNPSSVLLKYSKGHQVHLGEIPGSFGMEFIEIPFPAENDQVTIEFTPKSSGSAEFRLQILRIYGEEVGDERMVIEPEPLEDGLKPGEVFSALYKKKGMAEQDSLALIVTRVDSNQTADPFGEYQVRVR